MSAAELIRQEIRARGPRTFYEFMDLALYHPLYGYYQRPAPQRGRSGDYFTSLQVSALFPEIFADALLAMRQTLDSDQFTLLEMGAGHGEFLEGVLTVLKNHDALKGLRVWAVECARPARERLMRRLSRFAKCHVVSTLDEIEWMGGADG